LRVAVLALALIGCGSDSSDQEAANTPPDVIGIWSAEHVKLASAAADLRWQHLVDGGSITADRVQSAEEALAAFEGARSVMESTLALRQATPVLDADTARSLDTIEQKRRREGQELLGLNAQARKAHDAATQAWVSVRIDYGKPAMNYAQWHAAWATADHHERTALWDAAAVASEPLKGQLATMRDALNAVARRDKQADFRDWTASSYDMNRARLASTIEELYQDALPLYRELHTWARYELAEDRGEPVPDHIPITWLPDPTGQDWSGLRPSLNADFSALDAGKMAVAAETFFTDVGLEQLGEDWWKRANFGARVATTMDINHSGDIRTALSRGGSAAAWSDAWREVAVAHAMQLSTNDEIPYPLRGSPAPAVTDAVAAWSSFWAEQPAFLQAEAINASEPETEAPERLLREALRWIVGVANARAQLAFEDALYGDDIPADVMNTNYWASVTQYTGVAPPRAHTEAEAVGLLPGDRFLRPGRAGERAMATTLMFSLHSAAMGERNLLPNHAINFHGHADVGERIDAMFSQGRARTWNDAVHAGTGSTLDATPMVRYFEPLMAWLEEQNADRKSTL